MARPHHLERAPGQDLPLVHGFRSATRSSGPSPPQSTAYLPTGEVQTAKVQGARCGRQQNFEGVRSSELVPSAPTAASVSRGWPEFWVSALIGTAIQVPAFLRMGWGLRWGRTSRRTRAHGFPGAGHWGIAISSCRFPVSPTPEVRGTQLPRLPPTISSWCARSKRPLERQNVGRMSGVARAAGECPTASFAFNLREPLAHLASWPVSGRSDSLESWRVVCWHLAGPSLPALGWSLGDLATLRRFLSPSFGRRVTGCAPPRWETGHGLLPSSGGHPLMPPPWIPGVLPRPVYSIARNRDARTSNPPTTLRRERGEGCQRPPHPCPREGPVSFPRGRQLRQAAFLRHVHGYRLRGALEGERRGDPWRPGHDATCPPGFPGTVPGPPGGPGSAIPRRLSLATPVLRYSPCAPPPPAPLETR